MGVAEEEAQGGALLAGRARGGAEQAVDAGAEDAGRAEAEARGGGGDEAESGAVGEQQRSQRPLQRRARRHGQELADHRMVAAATCSAPRKRAQRKEPCESSREEDGRNLSLGG